MIKERRRDHAMLMEMVDAFEFQLVGAEIVNGHECWVLDARPKRGYEPKDRETKVLAGMRGELWVDQEPVSMGAGEGGGLQAGQLPGIHRESRPRHGDPVRAGAGCGQSLASEAIQHACEGFSAWVFGRELD
jgi:hypothetical protein